MAGSWNDILWPAYLKAHAKMFHNNDVEHGEPLTPPLNLRGKAIVEYPVLNPVANGEKIINGKDERTCGVPVDKLNLFNTENMGMEGLFITPCDRILGRNSANALDPYIGASTETRGQKYI